MKKAKTNPRASDAQSPLNNQSAPVRVPFIVHINELRKRFFYICISVGAFGALALIIHPQLTTILLGPGGDQQFIYTTPGGGFDFVFKLCLYTALTGSIPVIVYQFIRYLEPLIEKSTKRFVWTVTLWSSILAAAGIAFAYFVGLPATMHFLLTGFSSEQIEALITIQSYTSFVLLYLLGAALLFQLPLILLIINRFKPLRPQQLMKRQRWVILGAFILGAVVSPTPDITNQLMLSGPIILMYELSIVLIWLLNGRHRKTNKIAELLKQDAEIRAARLARFEEARATWNTLLHNPHLVKDTTTVAIPDVPPTRPYTTHDSTRVSKPSFATRVKPRRYVQDFTRRPYNDSA